MNQRAYVVILSTREVWRARKRRKSCTRLDDTYKLDHMEDKLTKLENTLKLETGLPKSGVIDLDTERRPET